MRCWILALIATTLGVGCTGCGAPFDPAIAGQFQRAQETFDTAQSREDFLRVAGIYQQIIDTGFQSGVVFYNQGNAYMRAGQRGRAIASYRQAQRFRPNDPLLDANLRSALSVGGAATAAPRPLIEDLLFWQDWISYPDKFWLSLASAGVTLAFGLASLFLSHPTWRRLAFAGLVLTGVAIGSAVYDWYRFVQVRHGVVLRSETMARKGDADSYEPAFTAPLAEGTECRVLEQRRGWARIRLSGSQEGWVRADDIVLY